MKLTYGIAMIIIALMLGLYLGIWLCIIGGLIQIIGEINLPNIGSMSGILGIVLGVIRVCVGAGFVWAAIHLLAIPGYRIARD